MSVTILVYDKKKYTKFVLIFFGHISNSFSFDFTIEAMSKPLRELNDTLTRDYCTDACSFIIFLLK